MINIGDGSLSYDMGKKVFHLYTPEKEYQITGFIFVHPSSTAARMITRLSFMAAAAEAQDAMNRGRFSDNDDMFEPGIMQWCLENASEIDEMLGELEGEKDAEESK